MRGNLLRRLAPLSGVLFVILVIVGGPLLEGSTPDAGASGPRVVAFYAAHRTRERAGAIVLALAFAALLAFAATLRARWRRTERVEGLSALLLAAATVLTVGQTVSAGVGYALAARPSTLGPEAAQALNLLANDLPLTSAVGFLVFGLTAGAAILRGALLPSWMGWLAIAVGILFVLPAIELLGLVLLLVWVLVLSVLYWRRDRALPAASELRPEFS